MQAKSGNLAHLATITSRNEALVIASALEHAGVEVFLDGMYHCSVDPLSVALGGHRVRVYADQWHEASELVRELGLPQSPVAYRGQQLAVLKILGVYVGPFAFFGIPAVIAGILPAAYLISLAVLPMGVQTDPRGRNEYYLSDTER